MIKKRQTEWKTQKLGIDGYLISLFGYQHPARSLLFASDSVIYSDIACVLSLRIIITITKIWPDNVSHVRLILSTANVLK